MKKKPTKTPEKQQYPIVFETFRQPGSWEVGNLTKKEPSCFNGCVSIKKYRVTFEEIDEPNEVLIARLKELWAKCDNSHHIAPLRAVAAGLGVELRVDDMDRNKR